MKKKSFTPGKPSSYRPNPAKATRGTAASGLKNLEIYKEKKMDHTELFDKSFY